MFPVLHSLADAYLTVGVYVATLFVLLGWLRVRCAGAFEGWTTRNRRYGPLMASLAAVPPGCIGVLAVSRMYVRGNVTYGSVLAALVSTMGDAAWLLLVEEPWTALGLKAGLFVIGVTVGYAVDWLGVAPSDVDGMPGKVLVGLVASSSASSTSEDVARQPMPSTNQSSCGGGAEPASPPPTPLPAASLVFWCCIAIGLVLSLPTTLHLVDEDAFGDAGLVVGVVGFAATLLVFARSRGKVVCGEEDHDIESRLRDVLRNGATEAAFVTVWVAIIFGTWDLAERLGWVDPDDWALTGLAWILVAAVAGLIPACGVEVLASALFVTGVLPLPALVTYLLSQDGNGLIPIASRRPRSAAHATVVTSAVAIIVGFSVLLLT